MEFWKNIKYKTKGCDLNEECSVGNGPPRISLYIVLGRQCNTACRFCTFRGKSYTFDYAKFTEVIQGILKGGQLGKVQFTGGEPGLYIDILRKCLAIIRRLSPNSFVSVNTNGTYLAELANVPLDNIALSRHAIKWEDNAKIMGVTNAPPATDDEIIEVAEALPNLLHLSCNLIKGYVDSPEKIKEYLDFAAGVRVYDVGFVSLMPVNKYCIDNFVDFKAIDTEKSGLFTNLNWSLKNEANKEVCRCRNYLYFSEQWQQMVSAYSRFACEHKAIASYLVYENNELRQGFNGQLIY